MAEQTKNGRVPSLFGKIYFSVLAIVTVIFLVFSFVAYYFVGASTSVTANEGIMSSAKDNVVYLSENRGNGSYTHALESTRDKIDELLGNVSGLSKATVSKEKSDVTNTSDVQRFTASVVGGGATYAVQDFDELHYFVDTNTFGEMGYNSKGSDSLLYASRKVTNYIVIVPGTKGANADAVLFMTHYDANSGSDGATSASSVSAMLAVIEETVSSTTKYENDIVFVLTDGRYEDGVGAYAFKNQFVGFDNVNSRIKVAFNFDAITAGGALTAVQTSDGNSALVSGLNVRYDASVVALMGNDLSSDLSIYYDETDEVWTVPSVNFMMTAGEYDAGGEYDKADNIGDGALLQYVATIEGLLGKFGNADISSLKTLTNASSVNFLGLNVTAHGAVTYVLAGVLLLALIGIFVFAYKKQTFSIENVLKGAGAVLLALALSLGIYAVAYFLIGLLSVAFGSVTLNMLFGAHVLSPVLFVPSLLFVVAVLCGLYPAIKKALHLKAFDLVRGSAILQMVIAVGFGFIYPVASLAFLIVGLLNAVVTYVYIFANGAIKAKFGFTIERLFPYTVPALIGLPFLISTILMICNLFSTISFIFLVLTVALLLSSITPYFDYLTPALVGVFEKLPKHTIRVVETITEDKEDPVKKGKFTTVTEEKVVNRKVSWIYHNWFGVSVLCTVTAIALLICAPVGANVNATTAHNFMQNYDYSSSRISESVYDNAIVCYVTTEYTDATSYKLVIKDEAVYQKVKYAGDDYDWWNWTFDEDFDAYVMDVETANLPHHSPKLVTKSESGISNEYVYDVKPTYPDDSQVILNVKNLGNGSTIKVKPNSVDDEDEIFQIKVSNPAEYVEVVLPEGYGDCTVTISSEKSVSVYSMEYCKDNLMLVGAQEKIEEIKNALDEKGIDFDVKVNFVLKGNNS